MPDPLTIGLLVLVPVAFYFLLIRPQSKRHKEQQNLLSQITGGETVMLSSGIVAKVVEVGESQVLVEIAPGLEMTVLKQVIISTTATDEFDGEAAEGDDAEEDLAPTSPDPTGTEDTHLAEGSVTKQTTTNNESDSTPEKAPDSIKE